MKISSAQMVAHARKKICEISTDQAILFLEDPNTVFVDLRDIRERHAEGFIPNSFHCPRGMVEFWVDPESPYHKKIFAQDKQFLFYCASGWRSALSVYTLQTMGFQACHLAQGFNSWKESFGAVHFS